MEGNRTTHLPHTPPPPPAAALAASGERFESLRDRISLEYSSLFSIVEVRSDYRIRGVIIGIQVLFLFNVQSTRNVILMGWLEGSDNEENNKKIGAVFFNDLESINPV